MTQLALKVSGLRKAYPNVVAVAGIDLEVRRGECFGLLGPNGAGKTTTLEICEGLAAADAGEVSVLGRCWQQAPQEIRERIGISLQETQLSEKLTVREILALFRSFYRVRRPVAEVLAQVRLEEKAGARVGTLSGGQKQRLALACALVGAPELLFLDEPTTGLDPQSRRQVWDLIEEFRKSGGSIVLTTHYMDEAQRLCDRIVIVDHGQVIARGTPAELILGLGAAHMVEVSFEDGAQVSIEALRELEGVRDATYHGGSFTLQVAELHRAVPALLQYAAQRGARLRELATHSATLEDVFVSLTGRHLRDG